MSSFLALLSRAEWRRTFVAAIPLAGCHILLLLLWDLAKAPYATLAVMACAFIAYAAAARHLQQIAPAGAVLTVAVILRLSLLALPETLSDDILRYVWDGRVVSAGFNPYVLAPDAPELSSLRDERWQRMPHRQVPTVYPPLALAVFSAAALLPSPEFVLKIVLTLADLFTCWLLILIAGRFGLPPGRAIWYAWSPLVCLEIAGMGHVDALVVCAQVAAVLWLLAGPPRPGRAAAAGIAAAAGVLAKLVPLVALPIWARGSRQRWIFLAVALGLTAAVLAPVLISIGGPPPGLTTYGVSWEFNGPLYEPLWRLVDRVRLETAIKDWLDRRKEADGRHETWNRFYPLVYPQLLAKGLLLGLFGMLFLACLRRQHPVAASGRIFGAVLLCSATLYPWYLLWILPWAALARHRAWLGLSALVQLSYLPQHTDLNLFPWIFGLIWLPFFLLLPRSTWSID